MDRRIRCLLVTAWLSGVSFASNSDAFGEDPVAQCISANEDSLTLRKEGKLVEARRALAACAAPVCPEAIQRACRGRMPDFNEAVPTVVLEVKDSRGRDMVDVKVSVDGQPMVTVSLTAMSLDPGAHVFRFEAPGQAVVESTVVVHEGQKDQPVMVVFRIKPDAASVPGPESSAGEPAAAAVFGPLTRPGSAQRAAGWIVGGLGIATMAAGGILGLVAKSSYDSAGGCRPGNVCTRPGFDKRYAAWQLGNVATGVFAGGAAVTAAGGVIWLSASRGQKVGASPSWRVGLTFDGAFADGNF